MNNSKILQLENGLPIGYAEYGASDGVPVIALHGMPNTRLMWKSVDEAGRRFGLRLIAPDRAGYGLSNGHLPNTLVDYPNEIEAFADALGLDKFVIMGASGGSPAAYACAYRLPHRLLMAVVISGIAPFVLPNSLREMAFMNRMVFTLGRYMPSLTSRLLIQMLKTSLPMMQKQVEQGSSGSPDMTPELYAALADDLSEVIRTSREGIAFDLRVFWREWGFRFEDIRSNVHVWHCETDNLAPARLAHYIAERIPDCEAYFFPDGGHIDPLTKHIDEIFSTIVRQVEIVSSPMLVP